MVLTTRKELCQPSLALLHLRAIAAKASLFITLDNSFAAVSDMFTFF